MSPSSHEEFEIRDVERKILESKEGKSIKELLREGFDVSESLLKGEEIDINLEQTLNKERGISSSPARTSPSRRFFEIS